MSKGVKVKKKCCSSRPRCRKCPVVLKRLRKQGLAVRREDGRYEVSDGLTKKQLRVARH